MEPATTWFKGLSLIGPLVITWFTWGSAPRWNVCMMIENSSLPRAWHLRSWTLHQVSLLKIWGKLVAPLKKCGGKVMMTCLWEWIMRYFGKKKRAETSTGWPLSYSDHAQSQPHFFVTSTFASFASISLRPWPGGQDSGKLQWTCEECKEEGFLEMVQKTDQELSSKGYKTIAPCLNCLLRVMRWGSDCIARWNTTWNAWILYKLCVHSSFDIRSAYHTAAH